MRNLTVSFPPLPLPHLPFPPLPLPSLPFSSFPFYKKAVKMLMTEQKRRKNSSVQPSKSVKARHAVPIGWRCLPRAPAGPAVPALHGKQERMWGYPRPGGTPCPVVSISLRAAQLRSPEAASACGEGADSSTARLHPPPLPPHGPAKGLSPGRMARSPTPPSPDLCRVLPAKQRRAQAGAQRPGDSCSATFCFINFFIFFFLKQER